jgi:hypothetical protein
MSRCEYDSLPDIYDPLDYQEQIHYLDCDYSEYGQGYNQIVTFEFDSDENSNDNAITEFVKKENHYKISSFFKKLKNFFNKKKHSEEKQKNQVLFEEKQKNQVLFEEKQKNQVLFEEKQEELINSLLLQFHSFTDFVVLRDYKILNRIYMEMNKIVEDSEEIKFKYLWKQWSIKYKFETAPFQSEIFALWLEENNHNAYVLTYTQHYDNFMQEFEKNKNINNLDNIRNSKKEILEDDDIHLLLSQIP